MNRQEILKLLKSWNSGPETPIDPKSEIIETLDLDFMFPNRITNNTILVAWEQDNLVRIGLSSSKEKLPYAILVSYPKERFYDDPPPRMAAYASILYDFSVDMKNAFNTKEK